MPLPFSFSAQRQNSESDSAPGAGAVTVSEVMQMAPSQVSTEPLAVPGNGLSPAAHESAQHSAPEHPRLVSSHLPPAPSPNQRHAGNQAVTASPFSSATLHLPAASYHPAAGAAVPPGHDFGAQIEQMRNDVFGIAMSVSALGDRVDRLEQRVPHGGESAEAGIATLRREIEAWLASHLNAAVEHCMQRFIHCTPAAAPNQPN